MSAIYAWLLLFLVDPKVADLLPADTFEIVDPSDPMDSSLFVDALFTDIPDGVVTDLCLVESGGCRKAIGSHPRDGNRRPPRAQASPRAAATSHRGVLSIGASNRAKSAREVHTDKSTPTRRATSGHACRLTPLDVPLLSALRVGLRAQEVCNRKFNRQSREIRTGARSLRDPCTSEDHPHRLGWQGPRSR